MLSTQGYEDSITIIFAHQDDQKTYNRRDIRHQSVIIQNRHFLSTLNRLDAITTGISCDSVAILVENSDDFCYNRDEKRRKSRVSVVLSFPEVVGNAITSTIATLHRHKKG